jgi:hypothetical protein
VGGLGCGCMMFFSEGPPPSFSFIRFSMTDCHVVSVSGGEELKNLPTSEAVCVTRVLRNDHAAATASLGYITLFRWPADTELIGRAPQYMPVSSIISLFIVS